MEIIFTITFLVLDAGALTANCCTLLYILKSFDIRTHVFSILFLDSLISTFCSGVAFIVDSLLLANQIPTNYPICTLAFLMTNLPCCFGAILTLLISQIRLTLAQKASKNIKPSNKKVLCVTLSVFLIIAAPTLTYYGLNAMFGMPIAFFVETCAFPNEEPRFLSRLHLFVLQMPNFFNVLSLITDLKMLRFLKNSYHAG